MTLRPSRVSMDQLAVYDSQEPEVDIAAVHDDRSTRDNIGSQVYELVELDESVYNVVSIGTTNAEREPEAADFTAANTFDGAKAGFVFKTGALGTGYYRDSVVIDVSDAETELQVSDEETQRRSRSRSAGRFRGLDAPDIAVDNLPARVYAPVFRGRLFPDGPPPKSSRGWSVDELIAVIKRCGLERYGSWRQGGQQERKVFEGDDFLINIHIKSSRSASTVWVQGKRANEVNTRLLAARRS